jgi:phosphonate metabolism-associated iron-containing alcohol dehydrogenase
LEYYNPVKISLGVDLPNAVSSLFKNTGRKLIFCSARFSRTQSFSELRSGIGECEVFSDIETNPSVKSLELALGFAKNYSPESIIAIGGGSVIDTAKVARYACYSNTFDIRRLLGDPVKKDLSKKALFAAVPTTHGSGSELTMWATVWDKTSGKKYSISDPENYPDFAIYDFSLFRSLPVQVTFTSTLDAFSHSFEALWNKNSNPISDHFATEGIKLILNNIGKIGQSVAEGVRKELILASMYAGLAFSNTKTAAAHSISYPLTLRYNIPHGIACSMPLFPLLKINNAAIRNKLNKIFSCSDVKDINGIEQKVKSAIKGMIPYSISEYGVTRDELPALVDGSFTKERMANNIVELSANYVLSVFEAIF